MENPPLEEHDHAHALPNEGQGQTSRQFKGIRLREWGKWVSEIRMPRSREKIYLGSYKTAEQAARAFDAASYCLRGPDAKFNFPDSVPPISSPSSLSRQQIQAVAAEYALNELPLPSISVQHNIDSKSEEKPSQSSSVSVTEFSSDDQKMSEELSFWKSLFSGSDDAEYLNLEKIPSIDEAWALEFWKSMFAGSDGAEYLNLENIPSIDEAWALDLTPTLQDEEVDNSVDPTALWNFQDV